MITLQELFNISTNHGYIIEIFIAEAVFSFYLKKRKHFYLRFAIGIPIYAFLALVIPNFVAHFVSGFFSMAIFLISLFFNIWCYDCSFKDVLFCCLGAQLAQNLSYNIEMLLYLPFRESINLVGHAILAVVVEALTYLVSFWIFVRRMKGEEGIKFSRPMLVFIEILACFFVYTVQFLYSVYKIDTYWVARLPLIFCCILALCFQSELLVYKRKGQENSELEKLIHLQGEQYKRAEDSINLINMKAHDLKHYIMQTEAISANQDELDEIKNAVEKYETCIKTGNKIVDTVLSEKYLLCEREKIPFRIMTDEIHLDYMRANDIASLFGNALDNAIEYETSVKDVEKRYIELRSVRKNGFVSLHFENYCPDVLVIKDGLPETTKADKVNHGFGLKSIKYIVKKYSGFVCFNTENSTFSLDVMIPIPAGRSNIEIDKNKKN